MLILVIRTVILYLTVILALRIMGKRQLGELQPSELVVAIMISDLASVPMQSIDIPLLSGIIPVLTLIVAEVIMSFASMKSKLIRRLLSGKASLVIYKGKIMTDELKKIRFNITDLMEELRTNGYHNIDDVDTAIVETSGKLSIIPKDSAREVTVEDLKLKKPKKDGLPFVIITEGSFDKDEASRSGFSEEELKKILKKRGITKISDILIASIDRTGRLFIQFKGE